jgi:nucleoside permease NupC
MVEAAPGEAMLELQSAFGVLALLLLAWASGENRHAVSLRQAAIGLVVTFVTAVALIKLPVVAHALMGAIVGVITWGDYIKSMKPQPG